METKNISRLEEFIREYALLSEADRARCCTEMVETKKKTYQEYYEKFFSVITYEFDDRPFSVTKLEVNTRMAQSSGLFGINLNPSILEVIEVITELCNAQHQVLKDYSIEEIIATIQASPYLSNEYAKKWLLITVCYVKFSRVEQLALFDQNFSLSRENLSANIREHFFQYAVVACGLSPLNLKYFEVFGELSFEEKRFSTQYGWKTIEISFRSQVF